MRLLYGVVGEGMGPQMQWIVASASRCLKGALAGLPQNVRAYFEVASDFDPSAVIPDYESWKARPARHLRA
jgi:hypothetical protein